MGYAHFRIRLKSLVIVPPFTSFVKFDKIWLFIDFRGAAQRSVYPGKRTA